MRTTDYRPPRAADPLRRAFYGDRHVPRGAINGATVLNAADSEWRWTSLVALLAPLYPNVQSLGN